MTTAVTPALRFLDLLWSDKRADDWLLLWKKANKRSHWFRDLAEAAKFADGQTDLYIGCCVAWGDQGENRRAREDQVTAIPGLWADIDFGGNVAHKAANVPPTEEAARELIDSLEHPPTLIVHSGFGLQPWWLLASPLALPDDKSRLMAKAASQRLQDAAIAAGKARGWKVDSVGDLARILRLPGTKNGKVSPPIDVRLIWADGPRYDELPDFSVPGGLVWINGVAPASTNGHGALPLVDPNPEANTVMGRGQEHWERILGGSSDGNRNVNMTSLAGRILQKIDVFDAEDVAFQWGLFKTQNRVNQPPLDEKELATIWASILKAEKRKKKTEDHGEAVKSFFTPAETGSNTEWHLERVMSRPPLYKLTGPKWDGTVELTAAQLICWRSIVIEASVQLGAGVDLQYAKVWEKSTKQADSQYLRLMATKTDVEATPEESDDSVLAGAILAVLAGAIRRAVESTSKEKAHKLDDESVVFGFRWMVGQINLNGVARVREQTAARMLARVACGIYHFQGCRLKHLSSTSIRRLTDISEGKPGN